VGAATTRQRFVYATYFENGNNTISGFALDVATGGLTPTPGSPYTTGRSPSLILRPSGDWLFATVAGNNTGTWVYRIDNATGRLTPVAGNPFTTNFTPGSTPVVDPAGRYLAMVSGTGVAVYRFDTATGTLTSTGSLVFLIGASFVNFTSDSRFMFVRDGSGNLRTLATDPLAVGPSSISPITPWSFSPVYVRGSRVVSLLSNGSVVTMTVDPTDGRLAIFGSQQTGSSSTTIQLAATADPSCLLLASREAGNSYRLLPVRIDSSNNSLSAGPALTVSGPATSRGLMLHPAAAFGYLSGLAGSFTGIITPLEISGSPCTVAANAGGNFSAVPDNQAVLFDSSGTLAIGAVAASAALHVSRIDSATRRITPVAGSPFATPSPPTSIVLRE
jgi:6-phosphogluconolactonase